MASVNPGDQLADRLPTAWAANKGPESSRAGDNQGIKKAFADCSELYNEYLDAGGVAMDFEERRTQILKILPKTLRLETFKNLSSFTSVPQIKEWVRIQTECDT